MTDVITGEAVGESADDEAVVRPDELDEQLVGQLMDRARSQGCS